jgi:hypothetical protein
MSTMNTESVSARAWGLAALLALAMVLTRLGHFGELSRLPDASWAVFFIGGLMLRDARAFAAFFGLAWMVDLGAMTLGTPVDCFGVAYLFLAPSYALLWWAGRAMSTVVDAGVVRALPRLALTLSAAVTGAFVVSNIGYFGFSGGFGSMPALEYASRVMQYLPGYLLVTGVYVLGGFLAIAASRLVQRGVRQGS